MATHFGSGDPGSPSDVSFEAGGALTIVLGLHRTRSRRSRARRRFAWLPLDIRRRSMDTRMFGWLPHGLPFAMGLSPIFAAWFTTLWGDRRTAPAMTQGAAATTEVVTRRPVHGQGEPVPQFAMPMTLPWILGVMPTLRGLAVAPVSMISQAASPSRVIFRNAGSAAPPRQGPSPPIAVQSPAADQPSLDIHAPGGERAGSVVATLTPLRPGADDLTPRPPQRPRATAAARTEPAATTSPNLRRGVPAPAKLAAVVSLSRVARSRTMSHKDRPRPEPGPPAETSARAAELAGSPTAHAAALSMAFTAGAAARREAGAPAAGEPRDAALPARTSLTQALLPLPMLSAVGGALHQLIAREVTRQIAAVRPPSPPAAFRSATTSGSSTARAPAALVDLPNDDFIRRLLSRMRSMSQEERFRGGLLR